MDGDRERVMRLIAAEFGPELQRDWMAHAFKSYEAAAKMARDFDPAQRRKMYGQYRLALMETAGKVFCRKHGLKSEDFRDPKGTYDYFTMSTKSLLITISRSNGPDKMPRRSFFRETIAAGTNYHLFEDVAAVAGRKFFHVVILHNCELRLVRNEATGDYRKVRVLSRPGFMTLGAPERDGKEFIYRTPLFRDHPETLAQLRGLAAEDVPGSQQNKPRARPRTDEGADTGSD